MIRKNAIFAAGFVFYISVLDAQARSDSSLVTVHDSTASGNVGWVSLQSNPEGAEVYLDTVFLGKTPLSRVMVSAGQGVFRVFYPQAGLWGATMNADTVTIQRGAESTVVIDLQEAPLPGPRRAFVPMTQANPDLFLSTPGQRNSRLWIGSAAGATSVVAGILSAYLKNKSDHEFDTYVATGDPALLNSTQRLDRWAGISLFLSEVGLGVLVYLLLSD
ncbi:MAG TPA: PEGA domain-containing protein [Bacteroidota bacterium]|nr:PEGA domain-containing protein [Bacteroidota bacterium]